MKNLNETSMNGNVYKGENCFTEKEKHEIVMDVTSLLQIVFKKCNCKFLRESRFFKQTCQKSLNKSQTCLKQALSLVTY